MMNIFQTLESEFHDQTSLEFSPQKSELYMPAIDDDKRAELMQRFNVKVTNRGVIALGIPLGNEYMITCSLPATIKDVASHFMEVHITSSFFIESNSLPLMKSYITDLLSSPPAINHLPLGLKLQDLIEPSLFMLISAWKFINNYF